MGDDLIEWKTKSINLINTLNFRIHGTNYSRIYESAVTHNISVFPQTQSFVVYNSDGTPGNTSLISDLLEHSGSIGIVPSEKPEALGNYVTKRLFLA